MLHSGPYQFLRRNGQQNRNHYGQRIGRMSGNHRAEEADHDDHDERQDAALGPIGRSNEEIVQARQDWMQGIRLGEVKGYDGSPTPAPDSRRPPLNPYGRLR
ncbi:hypothetical protein ACFYP6_29850 [Streptomyces goshikiensis]|uniref:hypothetical protein n=1 Tax=Streptomyces goshikiensis TaxID=1942 RepID=UPI0036C397A3